MKKSTKKLFIVAIALLALGFATSASAACEKQSDGSLVCSWSDLEQNSGPNINHKVGQTILFCDANASPTYCFPGSTPPPEIPCLSAHTVQVGGVGSAWVNLGSIRGVAARLGPADCHGTQIPAGTWQGVNMGYRQQ